MKARYRKLCTPEEAWQRLLAAIGADRRSPAETLPAADCTGRITARAVHARISSPPYHASAMDGIAVRSKATRGASATTPRIIRSPEDALPIDTGDPLPAGYDAVVPVERIDEVEGGFEITASAPARQHVRLTGEDMVAGEMILPAARPVEPAHVGAMLAAGVEDVSVRARPRVAVLPTGDELCQPGEDPSDGRVIESNSRMLTGLIRQWGGQPVVLDPVPDDPTALVAAIRSGLNQADVLLILAGSSAGRDDHTPRLIEQEGALLFHGITLMPGKPTAAGMIDHKPVLGVPGFPVSAIMAVERFLKPLLAQLLGVAPAEPQRIEARLARAVVSRPGLEEVIRVVLGQFDEGTLASPLGRGAGALTTLTRAHGLLRVPADLEGLAADSRVEVELLVPQARIGQGLLLAGSNDMTLAELDDLLGAARPGASLSVSPVGSLAGLAALARGEAHLAGAHLLDPQTGEYNLTDVGRILPGRQLALVTLAHRQQGLGLRPDDPRTPESMAQVIAQGLSWVNRQPGSGTRVLTDHLLEQAGLSGEALPGFEHEEVTHAAVAEAVRSHVADCGMLILAAARALGLRFVPLVEERYDLVIPRERLDDPRMTALLEQLRSPAFRARMDALGGYDARETGRVRCLPEGSWSL